MKSIYSFTLDMQSAVSQATLSARKGDKGKLLSVTLMSGGVPYEIEHGCYAVLNAVRASDGEVVFGDCVIQDNSITYDTTALVSGAEGRVDCDITLYSPEGQAITSPRFAAVVYAGVTTGDDIEDTDEYRTLGELVAKAEKARVSAEAAATQAAHGGAVSFNGRVGAVTPEEGDYTFDMVGADPAGAASSEVEAHNISELAHAELFGKCSKEDHTHEVEDVNDFASAVSSAIAAYGAAKIATGVVIMNGSTGTISDLAFTPKIIFLHTANAVNGISAAASLYAIYGFDGAIMRCRDYTTEGEYVYSDEDVIITWSNGGAVFAGLFRGNSISGYKYVAIG